MAFDEHLADRIRRVLKDRHIDFEEKRMFGGICYLVDDKMMVGVIENRLMARINPDNYESALAKAGARPMDFTKRPMKGFVYIENEGIDEDVDLAYWIELAYAFNPIAKSSKRKKQ